MNDLEARTFPNERGSKVALISTLPLQAQILEADVRGLEDLDRKRVVLILPQRLQQPWKQRCAHDLILCRLWIRQAHGRLTVVFAVEVGEILVVRAEDQGHDFGPAGHGGFGADDVAELVDGEGLGDGGGDGGEAARELVEAVGDGEVFHYIGLVEDICPSGWDLNVKDVGVRGGRGGGIAHTGEVLACF